MENIDKKLIVKEGVDLRSLIKKSIITIKGEKEVIFDKKGDELVTLIKEISSGNIYTRHYKIMMDKDKKAFLYWYATYCSIKGISTTYENKNNFLRGVRF